MNVVTWLIIGIISCLILAAVCTDRVMVNYHNGEILKVKTWGGIYGLTMLGVGFFVGLLVCVQKMS
jgi:hypothetical protein